MFINLTMKIEYVYYLAFNSPKKNIYLALSLRDM